MKQQRKRRNPKAVELLYHGALLGDVLAVGLLCAVPEGSFLDVLVLLPFVALHGLCAVWYARLSKAERAELSMVSTHSLRSTLRHPYAMLGAILLLEGLCLWNHFS